jgi:hypothetical protein
MAGGASSWRGAFREIRAVRSESSLNYFVTRLSRSVSRYPPSLRPRYVCMLCIHAIDRLHNFALPRPTDRLPREHTYFPTYLSATGE